MTAGWKAGRNSFFTKLLLAFLVVGAVPFLFHISASNFYIGSIRSEIVKNTDLRMNYTVAKYEDHLSKLEEAVAPFLNGAKAAAITGKADKYDFFAAVNAFRDEFAKLSSASNNLYVHNMFIAFEQEAVVIDKTGLIPMNDLFTRRYVHSEYGKAFWSEPFGAGYRTRVFPAVRFDKEQLDGSFEKTGLYFPVVFKHKINHDFYIGVFLDAEALFRGYSLSGGDVFQIAGHEGQLLYSSDPAYMENGAAPLSRPPSGLGRGFFADSGSYLFQSKGAASGLTYVNYVSNEQIAAQLSRLNAVLLSLLVLSVLLSLLLSVILSFKFKQPIQRLVHSLQRSSPNVQLRSTISEFKLIGDRLHELIVSGDRVRDDLHKKTKLLEKYGYLDLMKRINVNHKDVHSLVDTSKPFYFILFQIDRTRRFRELGIGDQGLTNYIVEYINLCMQQRFPGAITAQSEKDLVFSIVFAEKTDGGEAGGNVPRGDVDGVGISGGLSELLARMKRVFDRDLDFYFLTVAFNPIVRSASGFTAAYEDGMELLRQRPLNGETQIVMERRPVRHDLHFSPSEEREFASSLQSGNAPAAIDLVRRMMHRLGKADASAWQYRQFAQEMVSKLLMALTVQKIDPEEWIGERPLYEQAKDLLAVEEYAEFLETWVGRTASLIAGKLTEKDPILDYIRHYVESHYGEDIQQEAVATKLNISSGYMCNYIKSRSGGTFTDLLNDIRVSKAKQILEATDCKIHEVASQVGYRNANSFTRMFRKLTGQTPLEYRRGSRMAAEG
ncbi:helix-turn-helix domain-containing protein [Paenibacillus hemerocallicola]|uniref:Helix-turn-helix domain-containing protein n=1 Tax=Paenibacillus hemerocallicola TaxID=1172614 RepID=A0A5C4T317_9BACL|nr:AraC family transcriptional regulator [Paenibacillus hemerocallicola]TNJ63464.1 helix-turn-helix domain-containing protein [Paenibacillus hemerocallicola]